MVSQWFGRTTGARAVGASILFGRRVWGVLACCSGGIDLIFQRLAFLGVFGSGWGVECRLGRLWRGIFGLGVCVRRLLGKRLSCRTGGLGSGSGGCERFW